jgi:hypothetical protein
MKKKKGLTILDTTLWGGLLFGGFTLAIMLWDAYGPKGTADGIYTSVGPIINFVPEVAKPHLGFDVKVLAWLHGSVFAAAINFMVGAAIALFLAIGLRTLTKKK